MTPDDRLEREAERPLEPGQRRNVFGEVVCRACGEVVCRACGYHPPQHAEACPLDWAPGELTEAFGK